MVTRRWVDDDTGAGAGREAWRRRPRGGDRGGGGPGRFRRGSFALLVCILACRVASAGASPKLSALSFVGDVATLTPAFDPDTLSYNASVTTDRTSVQLAYAVASPDSASPVDVTTAVTQPSGRRRRNLLSSTTSALAISPGHNDVTLTVRRISDDAATAYAVRVTAYSLAAHVSLSGLSLVVGSTPVALPGPGFQANTLTYDVTVDYTTSAVSITPTAAYAAKCTMTVNGASHVSGQAALNVPTPTYADVGPNVITVTLTAEDGLTTGTYVVNVNRTPPPPPPSPPSSPSPPPTPHPAVAAEPAAVSRAAVAAEPAADAEPAAASEPASGAVAARGAPAAVAAVAASAAAQPAAAGTAVSVGHRPVDKLHRAVRRGHADPIGDLRGGSRGGTGGVRRVRGRGGGAGELPRVQLERLPGVPVGLWRVERLQRHVRRSRFQAEARAVQE